MEIKFYSTPGCRYCEKLKELFKRADINDYEDIQATSTEMKKDYPNATSFPYVVIDGEEVGGLVETAKFFLENGLVSAPKK
jgi:glutaredoxin